MKSAKWVCVAVVFVVVGFCVPGRGSEKDKNRYALAPKIRSVSVFKNGLGFFVREGEVELRDGWCVADKVPPAAFGTLAIYTTSEDGFVDIVGAGQGEVVHFNDEDEKSDAATIRKRLEQIVHLRVKIGYKQNQKDRTASGKLVSVGPKFLILEEEDKIFAVPVEGVVSYQLLDKGMRIHVAKEKDGGALNGKASVGIAHLQKGITWIPDYTLKILNDEEAELICRGTLVNEAEDLIHCDVNFVVGLPHFVHTNHMAPLAVGQVIRSLAVSSTPVSLGNAIMNRSQLVQNVAPIVNTHPRPNTPAVTAAQPTNLSRMISQLPMSVGASKDYTVYTKKDLTVRRGEKALVTLFRTKIRYSHRYTWNTSREVEHFFMLHNSTKTAWTTGPCLGLEKMRPMTEDLLKYTPVGGSARLKVSSAINIGYGRNEREIDRKLKAHSPRHNTYFDMVTLKGTLSLHNREKDEVTIEINAPVAGRPIEASDEGRLSVNTKELRLKERKGSTHWTVTLKPGERKDLTYTYERYVPSM